MLVMQIPGINHAFVIIVIYSRCACDIVAVQSYTVVLDES